MKSSYNLRENPSQKALIWDPIIHYQEILEITSIVVILNKTNLILCYYNLIKFDKIFMALDFFEHLDFVF